ncbi:hypothetical protein [Paenibacillus mucilaginosus]|uniref:hypothetical protein n=1 Tax=Paenibacillus mucilaginosus TaxID=61624 RepID=UPI00240E2327|nr:hypothetical protein [Paenibacillus mucilaginosus]
MTLLKTLAEVHGACEADGSWELWAVSERGQAFSAAELRLRLFAWHGRSLYGALLEPGSQPDSVRLSAYAALEYLAAPGTAMHLPLRWSAQLEAARQLAALGMEALRSGWYRPDAEAWQAGRLGWQLVVPEARAAEAAALLVAAAGHGIDGRAWFSRALGELLQSDPAVQAAWDELQRSSRCCRRRPWTWPWAMRPWPRLRCGWTKRPGWPLPAGVPTRCRSAPASSLSSRKTTKRSGRSGCCCRIRTTRPGLWRSAWRPMGCCWLLTASPMHGPSMRPGGCRRTWSAASARLRSWSVQTAAAW